MKFILTSNTLNFPYTINNIFKYNIRLIVEEIKYKQSAKIFSKITQGKNIFKI